jgi:hypothetical protein
MSDFLMIVPDGWVELDTNTIINVGGLDPNTISSWFSEGIYHELAGFMENMGIPLPVGQMITAGKVFDSGSGYKIWVTLASEV